MNPGNASTPSIRITDYSQVNVNGFEKNKSNVKVLSSRESIFSISEQICLSTTSKSLNGWYKKYHKTFTGTVWSIFFNQILMVLNSTKTNNEKGLKIVAWRNITYLQKAAELKVKFENRDQKCLCEIYTRAVAILFNDNKDIYSILQIVRTSSELSLGDGYIPQKM